MADTDSTPAAPVAAPAPLSSSQKENVTPVSAKIAELNESRSQILSRIQSLKQDLQSWRSKLDTQVKIYRDELSDLKKSLNVEVDQLRSEFQELRTTLQQQQEDVTSSLRNLGLQDASGDAVETPIATTVTLKEEADTAEHESPAVKEESKPSDNCPYMTK